MHRTNVSSSSELSHLSDLIGLIYEGATDPGRWEPDILPAMVDYLRAPKCIVYTPAHAPRDGGFHFFHGISQELYDLRQTVYRDDDVWTKVALERGLFVDGAVATGTDLVPHAQLVESKWYKGFLAREPGLTQLLTSCVFGPGSGTSMPAAMSFFRSPEAPAFVQEDCDRLGLILPHVSRSLGVLQRIRTAELTLVSTLSALDRLPSGVLLIDKAGYVAFANRAATRMLEAGDGLRLRQLSMNSGLGELTAENGAANRAIKEALSATISRDPYATPHFSKCALVPRPSSLPDYALQFSALGEHSEFGAFAAIIFITDGEKEVEIDPKQLQSAYGLTTAESRVAVALVNFNSVEEVAGALNLGKSTVRTHIKHAYAKLGVDSRPRFVKLLLGLAKARS